MCSDQCSGVRGVLLSDLNERGVDRGGEEEPPLTHVALVAVMEQVLVPMGGGGG